MLMLGKNFHSAMTKKVFIHFMTQKRTERCKFENKFYVYMVQNVWCVHSAAIRAKLEIIEIIFVSPPTGFCVLKIAHTVLPVHI